MNLKRKTAAAYGGIVAVMLIWGISPIIKKTLIGGSYSAAIYSAVVTLASAITLLIVNFKNIKSLNRDYFKVAVPTGVSLGVASLAQSLAYNFNASPTNQAFLENLSCVAVPIILFLAVKKRPSFLTVAAAAVCLASSMVLSGFFGERFSFHAADILNAFAGVMYGVNIAFTGIYAKKVSASLYVMIQQFVQSSLAFAMAFAFNFIHIGGAPIDKFMFSFDLKMILVLVAVGVISNALCWTVRTSAMKYVSANAVAVIMPFSSVLTGIFAIAVGQDKLSITLVIGAVLGLCACLMSALDDSLEARKISNKSEN